MSQTTVPLEVIKLNRKNIADQALQLESQIGQARAQLTQMEQNLIASRGAIQGFDILIQNAEGPSPAPAVPANVEPLPTEPAAE